MKEQPTLDQVGQNTHVEIELIDEQGNAERMTFDLVPETAADLAQGRLSVTTPLGKAIRGKRVGAEIPYIMGDIRRVRILSVQPISTPIANTAEQRQNILDEARRKAERTNADMFASSFSGKWGDYNTDEMES